MARVLFAWEYGGGLGHVMALKPVADDLQHQGHEIVWAVRDLDRTARVIAPGQHLLQAPLFPQRQATREPVCFPDVMATLCYTDEAELGALLQAWLNLATLCRPALILSDFAPTALLAARVLGLPSLSIGNGFTLPPRRYPLPATQPWRQVPAAHLAAADTAVTETVNRLLAGHGAAPIAGTADVFRTGETMLCTFPELDHYGARDDENYAGLLVDAVPASATCADVTARQDILVYLSWLHPWTVPLLKHLKESGAAGDGYVRDAPAGALAAYTSDRLRLSDHPLDIPEMLAKSRLLISHGGMGTTTQALLAGVPALMLPTHIEQALFAWRVQQLGAGLMAPPLQQLPPLAPLLKRALKPQLAEASAAFAVAHAGYSTTPLRQAILERCARLLQPV